MDFDSKGRNNPSLLLRHALIPLVRCRPRRSGVIWRARANSVPLFLSRATAPVDAGRGHVRELGSAPLDLRMSRSSPAATRRMISRRTSTTFMHSTARASRSRRPGRIHTAGPLPTTAASYREIQGLRRLHRRHLPRGRCDPRAYQHAGGDHVGARPRRPRRSLCRFDPPAGRQLAGRHAAPAPARLRSSSPRPIFST